MKSYFLGTATVAALALTQAAYAADLAVKAPIRAEPIAYTNWSGFYVGLEAGYGFGRNNYDDSVGSLDGLFTGDDTARVFQGGAGVIGNAFTGPAPITRLNNNGFIYGGFFGAQKQFGSWVFGIEGDIDGSNMKASSSSSSVSRETVVNAFFNNPGVVTFTGPGVGVTGTTTGALGINAGIPVAINGGTITIPNLALTGLNGTVNVPAQVVGVIGVPTLGQAIPTSITGGPAIPAGTTLIPGFVVPAGIKINVPDGAGGFATFTPTAPFTIPANGLINVATTALVAGTGGPVAVTFGPGAAAAGTTLTFTPGANGTIQLTGVTGPGGTTFGSLAVNGTTGQITTSGTIIPAGTSLLLRQLVSADVTRSVSVDTKIDLLSSVRGKVGFTLWDNVMIYGTGGLALAHATNNLTATSQTTLLFGDGTRGVQNAQTFAGTAGGTMLGWAAGGGIDYKLPNSGLVLGVEYLHYDFAKNTIAFSDKGGGTRSFGNNRQTVDAIKGRISFLFN